MLRNCRDMGENGRLQINHVALRKMESVVLCCLWAMYADRIRAGSLSKNITITMADLRFELEKYKVKDQIDKSTMTAILSLFSRYQLLQVVGRIGDDDCRICLLPSMQFALDPDEFQNFVNTAEKRMQERWNETDSEMERRSRMQTPMNRKSATRLLLVQWSKFQNVSVKLEGSTLFTGINGSGKSTILDAVTYLITGNTQFNKAAKDRDRTVLGYVRGDTKSNGAARYLRSGEVISYIAMEFDDPVAGAPLVVGVCIESPNETAKPASSWFVLPGTTMDQINFTRREGNTLWITPKNELTVRGERLKGNAFLGRERGTEQVIRTLGLRCGVSKYRGKLLKMMAFHPENNIDQFIQECVLEPGKIESLSELREQRQQFDRLQDVYVRLSEGKTQLEVIEKRSQDYEKKKRTLHIREMLFCYQDLQMLENEEKEVESQRTVLEEQLKDLEKRQSELEQSQKAAQERLRIAENSTVFQDMKETMDSLQRQIDAASVESRVWERRLKELETLEEKIKELGILLRKDLPVDEEEKKALSQLSGTGMDTEAKISVFKKYGEKVDQQDTLYEQNKIHLQDQIRAREKVMAELTDKIKKLEANCLVFPPEIERARKLICQELKNQGIDTEVFIFAELVQEILDPEWRKAVETFLGRKRFYLIIDGKYCGKAMKVLKEKKLYSANLVLTDKLPETEVKRGSAAEVLKIPNVYARRYANSLLNGIHLCEDLEELHDYPKGGLTRDGMLAKSYAVSPMDLTGTELCLGEDAVRLQLEQTKEERREKEALQRKDKDALARILDCRRQIVSIDWDPGHYEFSAADSLEKSKKTKRKLEADLQAIRDNPEFYRGLKGAGVCPGAGEGSQHGGDGKFPENGKMRKLYRELQQAAHRYSGVHCLTKTGI